MSTTFRWIGMTFFTDIHGLQRINPNDVLCDRGIFVVLSEIEIANK